MIDSSSASNGSAADRPIDASVRTPVSDQRIVFFGHDSSESTIRKRVNEFQSLGAKVTGFMFRRRHDKPVLEPNWTNFDLGMTDDGYHGQRLWRLLTAVRTIVANRQILRDADVLYARNIDMLALATVAKFLTRAKAPIVYEALDVHPAFTKKGIKARFLRFAERRLLSRSRLLIVSSPAFIARYFVPSQNYNGPWFLLENKLGANAGSLMGSQQGKRPLGAPPWVIGWFGVIRCQRSLDILTRIAARLPDSVIIHIRGLPSERDGITDALLKEVAAKFDNIKYFGVYQSPRDLAEIYGAVDLAWAADFSASGANSDWLIPNRFYEGGLNGVPAIARKNTATGDIVERQSTGWSLEEPFEETFEAFLNHLDRTTYTALADRISAMDRSAFVDTADTRQLLQQLAKISQDAKR